MKKLFFASLLFVLHINLQSQVFTKVSGDPVVGDDRYSEGSNWGDINNDGHLDLFVPDLFDDKKIFYSLIMVTVVLLKLQMDLL